MSSTMSPLEASITMTDYYVVYPIAGVTSIIAVATSIIILVLVWVTKPRLHTVRHLLMCNTCIASILFCIVQTINYVFLIFIRWDTSNVSCRWRGYFAYLSISAVTYSYLIQAISRFFIAILSQKYKQLTTFKTNYILILIQWLIVIVIPLPAIVTNDIYYRPTSFCWVPLKHLIHVIYTFFAYYIFPSLSVSIIYIYIYYRVRQMTNRAETLMRTSNSGKRDLELLRNITIPLCIYLLGGIPSILFLITYNKSIYLTSIASISLTVSVEKVCTIILDRDTRQVTKSLLFSTARVMPVNQCISRKKRLQNLDDTQQTHK